MKLLVDNQLPAALARMLSANGMDCRHVLDLGMETESDRSSENSPSKKIWSS